MKYHSTLLKDSRVYPGVRYRIRRPSLKGRLELLRLVRSEGNSLPFHNASEELADQLRSKEILTAIDAIYIRWALIGIEDLVIDDQPADCELLIDKGPESLCREIAESIREECFLSGEERKN
ncbi:MAG: hypothetical protein ACK527_20400 [Acidobacteriota bacterium]|jgi:hypothetical protein